ncbi:hypothetical protein JM83_2917 [Gillisia sp. Hel_I_86]|uniref:hypothetical protein n=1 Tax=Gillisia sp. Hel_I_86 TaxID=1249981 RepID=UPI00119B9400|nr:hypothetical protein [Gillisia sp. Hel_I_86]TVZ27851.1 hypothetical protein JM83_2917 [Gillisia sp. Hel_I_86]
MDLKTNVCFLLVLFSCLSLFSQQTLPEVTPPSPTAFELGKYGDIPVGMFTGTANVNIPLYNFKSKNLSFPISLSYNNSGIRVNQVSSWVGLGWNLNIGGVITRTVKGHADNTVGSNSSNRDFPDLEITEGVNNSKLNPDVHKFLYQNSINGKDAEHDLYNFNFMGFQGQFVIDGYDRIVLLNNDKALKITSSGSLDSTTFQITDESGIKYTFSVVEESETISICNDAANAPRPITAWYLSQITHPLGDQINLGYVSNTYTYYQGKSETYGRSKTYKSCGDISCDDWGYSYCELHYRVVGVKLATISTNNPLDGQVVIKSDLVHPDILSYELVEEIKILNSTGSILEKVGLNYFFNSNKRVFLDNITYKDLTKKHTFSYNNSSNFPKRDSKGLDHWGFYNGQTNNPSLLPRPNTTLWQNPQNIGADREPNATYAIYGLLSEVTFPTGGKTKFYYEPNMYFGYKREYVNNTIFVNSNPYSPYNAIASFSTSSNYSNTSNYPTRLLGYEDIDNFGCFGCSGSGRLELWDVTGSPQLKNRYDFSKGNLLDVEFSLSPSRDYELRVSALSGSLHWMGKLEFYDEQNVQQNQIGSGMRIKKTEDYLNDGQNMIKRYYYAKLNNLQQSTGIEGVKPDYLSEAIQRKICEGSGPFPLGASIDCFQEILSSSSSQSLLNQRGSIVNYSNVTVSIGGNNFENGAEEHEFIINRLSTAEIIHGGGIYLELPLFNQNALNNGFEKTVAYYRKINGVLKKAYQKEFTFSSDPLFSKEIPSYIVKKAYEENIFTTPQPYTCTSSDINKTYTYSYCATNHVHFWKQLPNISCIASGANNQNIIKEHPCNRQNKSAGQTVAIDAFNINHVEAIKYNYIVERYTLDKTVERNYDENGTEINSKVIENFYENPKNLQLTRQLLTTSDGNTSITTMFYADDVNSVNSLGYDNLTTAEYAAISKLKVANEHRIAIPIQTLTELKNSSGTVLSKTAQRTIFKDDGTLVLPGSMESSKLSDPLESRMVYKQYDNKGNPLEVSMVNGPTTVYIWGYNQQFPIAKIENATYSEVSSQVGNLQTKSNLDTDRTIGTSGTEGALRSALTTLRNTTALSDAMITTYTYDPLVGVTSVTDTKGYISYYSYDTFNRLQFIKDANGKILNEYKYNYKSN